jgi:hypothetical protein
MMLPYLIVILQFPEVLSVVSVAPNLDLAVAFAVSVVFG